MPWFMPVHLNNRYIKILLFLPEKTVLSLIKAKRLMLLTETIAVIVKIAGNVRSKVYEHSVESLNVKAGGIYRNNRA